MGWYGVFGPRVQRVTLRATMERTKDRLLTGWRRVLIETMNPILADLRQRFPPGDRTRNRVVQLLKGG